MAKALAVAMSRLEPEGSYGPAMAALSPLQRRFVIAMCETGGGNASLAYRMAGPNTVNENTIKVAASLLLHTDKVLLAIREEADRRCRSGAILGASALSEIAMDTTHKDRFKAASALLDRAGLGLVQKSEVVHVHKNDEEAIERIRTLAKVLGLDAQKLLGHAGATVSPPAEAPLDVEFEDVTPSTDGLEDLI